MNILSAPSDVEKVANTKSEWKIFRHFTLFSKNFGCAKDRKNVPSIAPVQVLMSSRMSILSVLSEAKKVSLQNFHDNFLRAFGVPLSVNFFCNPEVVK